MIEAIRIVAPATIVSHVDTPAEARTSMPKMRTATLRMVKTPALTTATACSSALTGVGATMAAGSQRWIGMTAALPMPKT